MFGDIIRIIHCSMIVQCASASVVFVVLFFFCTKKHHHHCRNLCMKNYYNDFAFFKSIELTCKSLVQSTVIVIALTIVGTFMMNKKKNHDEVVAVVYLSSP